MDNKTKNIAMLVAAGGLLVVGQKVKDHTSNQTLDRFVNPSVANMGGVALAMFAAYRMSHKAALGLGAALLASGVVNRYRKEHHKTALPLPGLVVEVGGDRQPVPSLPGLS